ncbi:putative reverse transcriptase domain-containing protein [Tanacetum coccineum]
MSWGWRKLLQLREQVRPFFWTQLGNGLNTSLWFDMWCSQSPLYRYLTPRDIAREGYNLQSKVADLMLNGVWNWPNAWLTKAPNLGLVVVPTLNSYISDCIKWREENGNMAIFSVKLAWEAFRPRGDEVFWYNTVWLSHCVPRHAFHLWLVMRRSLKTQDMLRPWDVDPSTDLRLRLLVSDGLSLRSFIAHERSLELRKPWIVMGVVTDLDESFTHYSPIYHGEPSNF